MVSDIPFPTPVGAVRIGKIDGNFVVNPDEEDLLEDTDLDLIVAGTEEAILMVEAGANEIPEAEILDALDIAHDEIKKLCAAQRELREKAGKEKIEVEVAAGRRGALRADPGLARRGARRGHPGRGQARAPGRDQGASRRRCSSSTRPTPSAEDVRRSTAPAVQLAFDKLEKDDHPRAHRGRQEAPRRPRAGRDPRHLDRGRRRPAHARLGAVHARPDAGVSASSRSARTREEMRLDTLGLETDKRYFHHYNFPPFSVGEAGFMRGPKRRDIGHGALAERALVPMIPSIEEFPYTIRVVSDILESNGSSLDGLGVRLVAVADGRRRADQARRSPASRWA